MSVDTRAPDFVKNYDVQLGSKGANVFMVQELLHDVWGETTLAVDSDFGPKTDAAVRRFQAANSLVIDGIVGPQTSKALQDDDSHDAVTRTPAAPVERAVKVKPRTSLAKAAAVVVGVPAAGYGVYRLGKALRWW